MENQTETNFGIEIPDAYKAYIDKVKGSYFMDVLKAQLNEMSGILENIEDEKWDYAYAPGKWTIKELLVHMMDAERIFAYRALTFARNDKSELPGFEENDYVPQSNASQRSPGSIISEYEALRISTIEMFRNFNEQVLLRTGIANGRRLSVILIGTCIAGHEKHHIDILKERYLK